jgi:hypothetical protein
MKNDNNKEGKKSKILNDMDRNTENERNAMNEEERMQRGEGRNRSQTEHEKATKALSEGYFPDGPGGNFRGV